MAQRALVWILDGSVIYYGCTAGRRAIMTIYTIGHSHVSIERFLALLALHRIDTLTDVRSQPYSRFAPQFNRQVLHASLARARIAYRYLGDKLGGRPKDLQYRRPDGTIDYHRLAQSARYQEGLRELQREAERSRLAVMCAEADFHHCHRYWLITRSLVRAGVEVQHVLHSGTLSGTDADAFISVPDQLRLL
jgi:uncharacterized protein (DUF488 family)